MSAISVAIVTFNSECHLAECLASVSWADEVVVFDLGSSDCTLTIVQSFGYQIVVHEWVPIVELIRQETIERCKHDWVLILDPDEIVPPSLAKQLRAVATGNTADAVSIPWKNILMGRWIRHSGWAQDRHIRFFRKGSIEYRREVHRLESVNGSVMDLPAEEGNYIIHYNYDSISQFLDKLNRYTTAELEKPFPNDSELDSTYSILTSPVREFCERFFWLEGYQDGLQGLGVCALMGVYHMVIQLKRIESNSWEVDGANSNVSLSSVRRALLENIRQLLNAMVHTTESRWLRFAYRALRKAVSLVIRMRAH